MVSCARGTRALRRTSFDARTFETNRAARQEEEDKLEWFTLAAALLAERPVLARRGWVGENKALLNIL